MEHRYNGQVILKDLKPASIYDIKVFNGDLICKQRIATKSNSTGEIRNYFNHEVLSGDSNSLIPNGTTFSEVEKAIKDLIKSAKTSVDYCAYNTSVTSIVNALIDAHSRGVRIRVIAESENTNAALDNGLPFQVHYDNKDALMHNKFIIVDANSDDNAHVVTGSMNFTTNQMKVDPNHLIFIQDKSLAQAYTIEFEEMWGSNTTIPNRANSKFGEGKEDNTPHIFNIGGKRVESYFSPTDRTASKIRSKLSTANESINCGLLILTHDLLIEELKYQASIGVDVKVVIDKDNTYDGILPELQSEGIAAFPDQSSTIFHYKTGVVDAENQLSDPILITGSHNWTYSADTRNDENTLIIHDAALADLYNRALNYWWTEWELTSSQEISETDILVMNSYGSIISGKLQSHIIIDDVAIYNTMCKKIETNIHFNHDTFYVDLSHQPNGIYFIRLKYKNQMLTKSFIKL
jgi:phosphatidylserine/phosphatidylglycerophosphate/cardiolipin synthase-like enzyme